MREGGRFRKGAQEAAARCPALGARAPGPGDWGAERGLGTGTGRFPRGSWGRGEASAAETTLRPEFPQAPCCVLAGDSRWQESVGSGGPGRRGPVGMVALTRQRAAEK